MNALRWQAPWFAAVQPMLGVVVGDAIAGRFTDCIERLNRTAQARRLVNANGLAIRFVDARSVDAPAYERHIWLTGEVPTRAGAAGGWHDLFNALVWITYPRIKGALNRLQAQAIERDGVGARRGGLRDAATLFDENAALFVTANRELADALRAFDWRKLFVERRAEFVRDVRTVAFGHALIDKLRRPYKSICAHAWIVDPTPMRDAGTIAALAASGPGADPIDAIAAATLGCDTLSVQRFAALPVLGIPGWWPPNRAPEFYRDARVFRAARVRRPMPADATE